MNKVYVVMEHENTNYAELDEDKIASIWDNHEAALTECDRLTAIAGDCHGFLTYEVIVQPIRRVGV